MNLSVKSSSNYFGFQNSTQYSTFKQRLAACGFTDKGVIETLGVRDIATISENDLAILLKRTRDKTPLNTFIRLFLIEYPCGLEQIKKALSPLDPETLVQAGLIFIESNRVLPAVKLIPFRGLYLVFDRQARLNTKDRQDYVMGVGSSTLTLSNLTIRNQVSRFLDLGSGCGTLALIAASHSDHVTAADLNPRAVAIARFNAMLNGMDHVDCIQGSFFDPFENQAFDLITTNPPFVISPEDRYIYRDSQMPADNACRHIVQKAPRYLNEGGYLQMLCNWVEIKGVPWQERLETWFAGSGCNGWVIRSETLDAQTYIKTWIRHTEQGASEENFAQRFDAWLAYFQKHDIDAVGAGLITMKKASDAKNWFKAEHGPENMLGPCGEDICLGYNLKDFLENHKDDQTLLDLTFQPALQLRLERFSRPSGNGWIDASIRLKMIKGFEWAADIDPFVADMIGNCDGKRPLGLLLEQMARSLEKSPSDIAPVFFKVVRGLIEKGFLIPPHMNNGKHPMGQ